MNQLLMCKNSRRVIFRVIGQELHIARRGENLVFQVLTPKF